MKLFCPSCSTIIAAANMNVATDVATCLTCHEVFAISSQLERGLGIDEDFDFESPPKGARFEETATGWRVSASTRSIVALFLVPFMCAWSGGALGGIFGPQIAQGQFDLESTLFGIPFLLGTLLFGSLAAMTVCGRVEVTIDNEDGQIFTGVGPVGWRRRFDWSSIDSIVEKETRLDFPGTGDLLIALVGKSRIKFGSMLSEARRFYLLQVLRKKLALSRDSHI